MISTYIKNEGKNDSKVPDWEMDPFDDEVKSKDGLLVTDEDNNILMVNEVFFRIWEIQENKFKKRTVSNLHKLILPKVRFPETLGPKMYQMQENRKEILRTEVYLNNNKVIDVHSFPMFGADDDIHGRIWYFRDITEQKRVEDLRKMQALIVENLSEGIQMAKVEDNKIVYTNQKFDNIFGYKKNELVGKHVSVLNFGSEKMAEKQAKEITDSLTEVGYWAGNIRNIKKNGKVFWTMARVSRLSHSEFGDVWVSMQRDISEHKATEIKLLNSEQRFKILFENSIEPMLFITANGGIVDVNPAACKLLGRSAEELMKIGRKKVVNYDDPRWKKLNEIRAKTGRFEGSWSVFHKDGHLIEVEGSSVSYFDEEGIEHTHLMMRDVTEKTVEHQKLQESEKRFRLLFEHSLEAIVFFSKDGIIQNANYQAGLLFGIPHIKLLGMKRSDLIDESDKRFKRFLSKRDKIGYGRGQFRIKKKDGSMTECEVTSVDFKAADGLEHAHFVFRDISMYLDYEKNLSESKTFYETLFEASEDPIVIWDPENWTVINANSAALRRLQFKNLKSLKKAGGPEIFSPGDQKGWPDARKMVEKMGKKAIKEGVAEFEWQHRTKEGLVYPVYVKLTPIRTGNKIFLQANIKRNKSF